jgi:hypothetical protein
LPSAAKDVQRRLIPHVFERESSEDGVASRSQQELWLKAAQEFGILFTLSSQ